MAWHDLPSMDDEIWMLPILLAFLFTPMMRPFMTVLPLCLIETVWWFGFV